MTGTGLGLLENTDKWINTTQTHIKFKRAARLVTAENISLAWRKFSTKVINAFVIKSVISLGKRLTERTCSAAIQK